MCKFIFPEENNLYEKDPRALVLLRSLVFTHVVDWNSPVFTCKAHCFHIRAWVPMAGHLDLS